MALAYFITFTTYGTWLPGTDKGAGSVDKQHNVFGTPFVAADADRAQAASEAMTQEPYTLLPAQREVVRDAIRTFCIEKGWQLLALHVRSNHIHLVIAADREPGRLMSDIKGRASRELTRAGFDDAQRKRWTRHGSTRYLFQPKEVENAVRYTLHDQGTVMAIYDGTNDLPPS